MENPLVNVLFTPRNLKIVDELKRVASEVGESPVGVALSWVCGRTGVISTLMGVSRPEQVAENASALAIDLSEEDRSALNFRERLG